MANKSYKAIQQEIEKLQLEAEALRTAEVDGVIARIKEAIEAYGIAPEDLFGNGLKVNAPQARGGKKSKSTSAKYQNGLGGEWGGRGPRPLWLRAAIANRHSLEEFLVA